jgi:L-ascorbate metabolism protein UlaG (beta-lactamase superfamily)
MKFASATKLAARSITFAVLLLGMPFAGASGIKITYLANEGVLLDCHGEKVFVDALFRDSLDEYARNPPDVQEKMETGKPPFDGVVLALATHFHLDHWDAGAIARFLKNNPHAVFASTPDATAMLPWSMRQRIHSMWPGKSEPLQLQIGDIAVDAFPLDHGAAQNLAYRISMCGQVLMHLGDAEASEKDFAAVLQAGPVDVGMLPFWWLQDPKGSEFVKEKWKPRQIVVLHFGGADLDEAKQIQANWPQAWVCTRQGEARKF